MLNQLRVGDKGRFKGYLSECPRGYRYQLMAMGLLPGAEFEVIRVAPLGDPIEIRVNQFSLTLRGKEAAYLDIESLL